jgi:exosortase/archaeosortase family protein
MNLALPVFLGLCFANAVFTKAAESVHYLGWAGAILATFQISAIIWASMALMLIRTATLPDVITTPLDRAVVALTALTACYPVPGATWIGLTVLALYFAIRTDRAEVRALAILLLALCFTGQWSRLVFRFFMDFILGIDAALVATLAGTDANGNVVYAADGQTRLLVLEGCSSFGGVSLSVLAWVLARTYFRTRSAPRGLLFIGLSALAVIVINTIRIAVIARRPDLYDLAHGPVGAGIASVATTLSVAAICIAGAMPRAKTPPGDDISPPESMLGDRPIAAPRRAGTAPGLVLRPAEQPGGGA